MMSLAYRRSGLVLMRRYGSKVPKNGDVPGSPKKPEVSKAGADPMPEMKQTKHQVSLRDSYQPKERYQRVSFEYPTETVSKSTTNPWKWKKYFPHFALLIGGSWALYTYSYFTKEDIPQEYLHPDKFIPFIVSNKVDVDKDHYLIELTPKYDEWKKKLFGNELEKLWNGRRLWSVEIKQPQIMVVRKYTPLPLTIYKEADSMSPVPAINIQNLDSERERGKLVFYIKKYDQGEVARWIHRKPLGAELELRGPFVEYEFPASPNDVIERPRMANLPSTVRVDPAYRFKPDNLAFFAAGTGIAPILQSLLSPNPYKGHVDIYYSRKTESEAPIPRFLFFLEKLDRVKIHNFINSKGDHLTSKSIPTPIASHYKMLMEQQSKEREEEKRKVEEKLKQLKDGTISPSSAPKFEKSQPLEAKHSITKPKYKTIFEKLVAEGAPKEKKDNPSLALVCGPDGYVTYVAGAKPYEGQGPVGGLLKEHGWDETNVFKL